MTERPILIVDDEPQNLAAMRQVLRDQYRLVFAAPMRYVKILFMTAFGVLPVLLMLKVISRFFLQGFKGQRLSFIENMFMLYYIVLTKEARDEWQSYIEEQKNKESNRQT